MKYILLLLLVLVSSSAEAISLDDFLHNTQIDYVNNSPSEDITINGETFLLGSNGLQNVRWQPKLGGGVRVAGEFADDSILFLIGAPPFPDGSNTSDVGDGARLVDPLTSDIKYFKIDGEFVVNPTLVNAQLSVSSDYSQMFLLYEIGGMWGGEPVDIHWSTTLTPVPEPSSILLLSGLLGVFLKRKGIVAT